MDIAISGGDYVPDGRGGFATARGAAETAQKALFRLCARRGEFMPLPEFGSLLHAARTPAEARAAAQDALRGLDGVSVGQAEYGGDGRLTVRLAVGDGLVITGGLS